MKVFLPSTLWGWVVSGVLVVLLAGGMMVVRVARVDGDSMIPLATGDRLVVVKGLTPREGDMVLFQRSGDATPQVKLVVEATPGTPCGGGILRPGEIYVEGTNPLSEKVGIIPTECVVGVVKVVLVFPHGGRSTVEVEDGPRPAAGHYEIRELSTAPDRVSHIAGEAMNVCGDARKFFPKGATIVTETMGEYKVVESYLIPNEEGVGGGTVVIVDPPDFAPPGEERIVEIKGP